MLYMKEMRAKVVQEYTLKESAAINQILGKRVSIHVRLHVCVAEVAGWGGGETRSVNAIRRVRIHIRLHVCVAEVAGWVGVRHTALS